MNAYEILKCNQGPTTVPLHPGVRCLGLIISVGLSLGELFVGSGFSTAFADFAGLSFHRSGFQGSVGGPSKSQFLPIGGNNLS